MKIETLYVPEAKHDETTRFYQRFRIKCNRTFQFVHREGARLAERLKYLRAQRHHGRQETNHRFILHHSAFRRHVN